MKELIDLSHTIEDGMITYKGLPAPVVCDYLSREESKKNYAEGTSFHIGKIEMVSNTGTYIDSPFHRYADGDDISQLNLEDISQLDGLLITVAESQTAIGKGVFTNYEVKNKAVLVHTNWSRHWRTDTYFEGHPYLTEEAALFLRDSGARLVGIDSHNIDCTAVNTRPVHSVLLAARIPIVEHLCNLDSLMNRAFLFNAVPCKVKNMGTFPVRAHAVCY